MNQMVEGFNVGPCDGDSEILIIDILILIVGNHMLKPTPGIKVGRNRNSSIVRRLGIKMNLSTKLDKLVMEGRRKKETKAIPTRLQPPDRPRRLI